MSSSRKFLDLAVAGAALPGDIDDYVSAWHNAESESASLAEYLGMSDEEYRLWFEDPSMMDDIISARQKGIGLRGYIQARLIHDYRQAASAGQKAEMKRLEGWMHNSDQVFAKIS